MERITKKEYIRARQCETEHGLKVAERIYGQPLYTGWVKTDHYGGTVIAIRRTKDSEEEYFRA